MARRYAPDHKALIMLTLERNNGDISLTSLQIGVPERTLRHWRIRQKWQKANVAMPQISRQKQELPSLLPPEIESVKEDDVFKYLREQLMRGLLQMVANLADDMDEATFHQRMTALAKLVDRFPKVTSWLPQDSSQVVRIVYQDPDGSVHESPPWTRRTATNA